MVLTLSFSRKMGEIETVEAEKMGWIDLPRGTFYPTFPYKVRNLGRVRPLLRFFVVCNNVQLIGNTRRLSHTTLRFCEIAQKRNLGRKRPRLSTQYT